MSEVLGSLGFAFVGWLFLVLFFFLLLFLFWGAFSFLFVCFFTFSYYLFVLYCVVKPGKRNSNGKGVEYMLSTSAA